MLGIDNIEKKGGFIIKSDLAGYINEVVYNTLDVIGLEVDAFFPFIVKQGTYQKGLNFMQEVKNEGIILDWELNVKLADKLLPMEFHGVKVEDDELLILAVDNVESILLYYEEMAKMNNKYINYIRELIKERMVEGTKDINDLPDFEDTTKSYQDMSKLNNELINLQRELTKKNKKLADYSARLEAKNEELENTQQRLDQELDKASQLHKSFLPRKGPDISHLSFVACYRPAHIVGGDFYNFVELDNKILFYLIDVSGHGLDGALLNIFLRETINNYLLEYGTDISLLDLLEHINYSYRQEDFPEDYFFCISFFLLDTESMELTCSNSGFHIVPYLISQKGKLSKLEISGLPISTSIPQNDYNFSTVTIKLTPLDILFVTSDGLIEEENGTERYGKERLENLLERNYQLRPSEILTALEDELADFIDRADYQDDITCFIIKNEGRV
mgnify:CR=1 FL=1